MTVVKLQARILNKEISFQPKLNYEIYQKKQTIKKLLSDLFNFKNK